MTTIIEPLLSMKGQFKCSHIVNFLSIFVYLQRVTLLWDINGI